MKATDMTAFNDYERHLRDHFETIRKTGRILVVTNHGKPDTVMMTHERYEQLAEAEAILDGLKQIDQGTEDLRAGRIRPARDAIHEVAADLDIELES